MPNPANTIRWPPVIGIAIVAVGAFVFGEIFLAPWHQLRPFWDKYQRVQLGMTEAQVEEICGPPTAMHFPGKRFLAMSYEWTEGDQSIAIDLDMDGKVGEKRFRLGQRIWQLPEREANLPRGN
jgi:hypothetical protein